MEFAEHSTPNRQRCDRYFGLVSDNRSTNRTGVRRDEAIIHPGIAESSLGLQLSNGHVTY
jgi:hypothetical protein